MEGSSGMPGTRGGEGDGGCPGQRPSGWGNVCECRKRPDGALNMKRGEEGLPEEEGEIV